MLELSNNPQHELFLYQLLPLVTEEGTQDSPPSTSLIKALESYRCRNVWEAWFNETGSTNMRPPSSCPIQPYAPPILILTINRFNEINASSSSDRENKAAIYLLRFSAGKEQTRIITSSLTSRFLRTARTAKYSSAGNHQDRLLIQDYTAARSLDSINGFHYDDHQVTPSRPREVKTTALRARTKQENSWILSSHLPHIVFSTNN
jgi:hypothetical protein